MLMQLMIFRVYVRRSDNYTFFGSSLIEKLSPIVMSCYGRDMWTWASLFNGFGLIATFSVFANGGKSPPTINYGKFFAYHFSFQVTLNS